MAKQQRKEPWNSRVTNGDEASSPRENRSSRSSKSLKENSSSGEGVASTVFLSILVFLMFAIIGGAIFFTIWNNRNVNSSTVASHFYPLASSSSTASSSSSTSTSSTTASSSDATSSSSSSSGANTYTYQGETSITDIEADAGVSWATLAKYNSQLNPNWGQPNDSIGYPLKNGTYLTVGTVLKTAQ